MLRASASACGQGRWLVALESVLVEKGLVTHEELDERTEEYELGERDEVY
jgi:hypothetical protein